MPQYMVQVAHNHHIGRRFVTTGIYRVPEDFTDGEAKSMVEDGLARRLPDEPKPEPKPAPTAPARRTYTRRKTAAPENKVAEIAENKTPDRRILTRYDAKPDVAPENSSQMDE